MYQVQRSYGNDLWENIGRLWPTLAEAEDFYVQISVAMRDSSAVFRLQVAWPDKEIEP